MKSKDKTPFELIFPKMNILELGGLARQQRYRLGRLGGALKKPTETGGH